MGLSETIVAAAIGAAATVCTAMFQLFTALRTNKADVRVKRGTTVKSMLAVGALMAVSAIGGYLFSEVRNEHSAQDLRSMRDELNAKLQVLALTTERLAAGRAETVGRESFAQSVAPAMSAAISPAAATMDHAESFVYAPACTSNCSESSAALNNICVSMPMEMQVRKVELSVKRGTAEPTRAEFNQDVGGGKFVGAPVEYAQAESRKVVCVNFAHWSDQPHTATAVMYYGPQTEMRPLSDAPATSAAIAAPATLSTPTVMAVSATTP